MSLSLSPWTASPHSYWRCAVDLGCCLPEAAQSSEAGVFVAFAAAVVAFAAVADSADLGVAVALVAAVDVAAAAEVAVFAAEFAAAAALKLQQGKALGRHSLVWSLLDFLEVSVCPSSPSLPAAPGCC